MLWIITPWNYLEFPSTPTIHTMLLLTQSEPGPFLAVLMLLLPQGQRRGMINSLPGQWLY